MVSRLVEALSVPYPSTRLRARCDTVIGTHGKGNAFCLYFFGAAVFPLLVEETLYGNPPADFAVIIAPA